MSQTFLHRRQRVPRLSALLLALLTFSAGAAAPPVPVHGVLRSAHAQVQSAARHAIGNTDPGAATRVVVQPALLKALDAGERQDYVIELRERADLSAAAGMDWTARGRYVVEQLKTVADRSQAALRRQLAGRGVDFEPHWIKNVILVRGGDAASVRLVASHPSVARIGPLPKAELVRPQPGSARPQSKAAAGVPENIAWIGADQAWAQGTRGHGVTVGVIDTGAYFTHEALRRQYRGWLGGDSYEHDYNWYFPGVGSEEPVNYGTHGSHVIGTIVGDDHDADPAQRNRIGVAPGARWIACLGLTEDGDNAASLLSCGEFMLAPTRTDGSDPDPDRRPQVINNSWSENTCNGEATSFYADVVDAWVASGMFPVFAAGNTSGCGLGEPPGLSSISSPASLASAFAVGSTGNHDGTYATHSLWGPTTEVSPGLPLLPDPRGYPQLKPQVVAPGVDILSAYDGFEGDYGTMTGTSMSAPHIAGVVALMLEAGECLAGDYPTLGTLLMSTATPRPYDTGGEPAPGPGDIPNYATGWGEVDAAAAVNAAAAACGPQGFIAGRITDGAGDGIPGARVEIYADEAVRVWELTTEPDGSYVRRLPEDLAGGYSVRVSAYGFVQRIEAGVTVAEDTTTPLDLQLATAALATVQGQVRDAATGWPLHARLRIAGYPDGAVWSGMADGRYSVQLPVGASYRIDVDSDIPGYLAATQEVAVAGATTHDVALAADATRCDAPGYAYATQLLAQDFETGTPPAGWSVSSAGEGWRFGTHAELNQPLYWPIPARDGRFAATIDPFPEGGNDGRFDMLVSPPLDLGTATTPVLRFASLFWSGSFLSRGAYVEASTDDGASWQPVGVPVQDSQAWSDEALSLAAFAGQTVRVRFHYDDGSTDDFDMVNPGWAVDDVAIVDGCAAPAGGGLVVGHVRDANTGAALDGAVVGVGAESTTTRASADPAVGEGFFALWAGSGSASLAATRGTQPEGYGDASATVPVADGTTVASELALPAGLLAFAPAAGPQATVELGSVTSVPFTLRNDGTLPLNFALQGQSLEQHFEDGVPPADWTTLDNGVGCPWSLSVFANSAGGNGESAGVYPYDCWHLGRLDNSLVLPPIDLSTSASASLGFFLALHQGPGSESVFDVEVSTDAGTSWLSIYTEDGDTFPREPTNLVELDLTDFVGQPDVRVRLRYRTTPPWGDIQVDQVHVFRELGVDDALSIAPSGGSIPAGGSIAGSAEFDGTRIAQPGTYEIAIRVDEDTPYTYWFGDLVGTVTATAPASWGSVAGTVQSLGRCEAAPAALAGLPLRIVAADGAELLTETDDQGAYRYWLDSARGPYTVRVEADQHVAAEREVTISAGLESSVDIALRPDAPCVVPDPQSLAATVQTGGEVTRPLDLLNLGAAEGEYAARIGGDPAVPSALRLTQNLSSEPEAFFALGCFNPALGTMTENHWYRVFALAERGLAGSTVLIDGVRFGGDSVASSAGTQRVQVAVHALDGPLLLENLTLLASTEVPVADTALDMFEVRFDTPVAVPVDATVVVEVAVPDGEATASTFYLAGNSAGDTAPGYFRAADCGFDQPTSYDDVGFDTLSPILELDVRASDACGPAASPVPWLQVAPDSGVVAGDGATTLQATMDAAVLAPGGHGGAVCISAIGPGDTDAVVPVQLEVGAQPGMEVFGNGFE